MAPRLRVYHASNGALGVLLALALLGRGGGVVWIGALVAAGALPVVWILMAWRARARSAGYTPRERAYARGSIAVMVLAWIASLGVAGLTSLFYFAFRPHSKEVERFESPGLGTVVNHTQIEPEFGDGGIRRNYYSFEGAPGVSEEIGRYEGDAGRFAQAGNLALLGAGERLELVVGGFHARRSLAGGGPRWKTWVVGDGETLSLLRRHLPPVSEIERAHRSGEAPQYPMPRLLRALITSLDPEAGRLEARGWFGAYPEVDLVYRRAGPEAPWELDVDELLARNEPATRPAFPAGLRVEYATIAVEPKVDLFHPGVAYDEPDPERLPAGAGLLQRAGLDLDAEARATIPVLFELSEGRPFARTQAFEGAWTGSEGRLYFFFSDRGERAFVRSALEGRWSRVDHVQDERASYMLLVRLVR